MRNPSVMNILQTQPPCKPLNLNILRPKYPRGGRGIPYPWGFGVSRTNASALLGQSASIAPANPLPDCSRCISINPRRVSCDSGSTAPNASGTRNSVWYLEPDTNVPSASYTQANPPVIPAPKLIPTRPSTTTTPLVMYSQPWLPTPSTTAIAPEFRTANRSPARPAANNLPAVAPYNATLPRITCCPLSFAASPRARITSSPPDNPLPTK